MNIILATTNPGKLRDFRAIIATNAFTFRGEPIVLGMLPSSALQPAPIESGSTFEENAWIKAFVYSKRLSGEFVLADDSGIEIDALGGAPGVHSARYAALKSGGSSVPGNADDQANNDCVLREMRTVPDALRTGRFVCALVLAKHGERLASVRGTVEGHILRERRGASGFGYDPLFYLPELGKTFAEISAEEKSAYSHRGRAFRELMRSLNAG